MRPVNLIPHEERSGERRPLRSGPLAYVVLGGLVATLAAVTALVLTGNQVADREDEVAKLKAEDAAATAKAESLAAFTQFRDLRERRLITIASLADSRFDWERVMRELALVLPRGDVWLVGLTATASPAANVDGSGGGGSKDGGGGGSGSTLRASVPGPALELSGCASGQEAVAGFVTALKDIDGVTRVGVQSSELSDQPNGAADTGGSEGESESNSDDDCRTREFIAKFEIVAAFDAAPVPLSAEAEAASASASGQTETAAAETEGG